MSDDLTFIPPVDAPKTPISVPTHEVLPHTLPLISLNATVVLPFTVISIPLSDEFVTAAEASKQYDRKVILAIRTSPNDDDQTELVSIGTIARIEQIGRLPGPSGNNGIVVRGLSRAEIHEVELFGDVAIARYVDIEEPFEITPEFTQLKLEVHAAIDAVLELRSEIPQEIRNFVRNIDDPRQLADNTGYSQDYTLEERITLLTTIDVSERLRFVRDAYRKLLNLLEVQQRIRQEVEDGTAKQQREFYLRQQLRAIQKELGEDSEELDDIDALRTRLREANLPEAAQKEADRELLRLQRIGNSSPEHHVIRTYLEWVADLPWHKLSGSPIDVAHTRAVLDADHYGLTKVKDRILEYLAVRRRRATQPASADAGERSREPILALIGPPGVGKTSLGQSIAKALGRSFVRMSLGGVRDEAELRGFRRTYIGSAPGRIIQELRRAGAADPVMLLVLEGALAVELSAARDTLALRAPPATTTTVELRTTRKSPDVAVLPPPPGRPAVEAGADGTTRVAIAGVVGQVRIRLADAGAGQAGWDAVPQATVESMLRIDGRSAFTEAEIRLENLRPDTGTITVTMPPRDFLGRKATCMPFDSVTRRVRESIFA
ncbi:MAG: AAA family ATPase, partial [Chloroflexia bacterium]|nr:AAA family ATPase [Chloroflexia bacterium]